LAATSAFVQSTVGIDGIINYGLARTALHANSVGNLKGDRNVINFRVTEDMGGCSKVSWLGQMRFSPTSGNSAYYASQNGSAAASAVQDGRGALLEQTKLTIENSTYGKLDLGRFTNFVGIDASRFSLQEDSGYGANAALAINGRFSGQTQYTSPKFNGIYFQALYVDSAVNAYNSSNAPGMGLPTAGVPLVNKTEMNAKGLSYDMGPLFLNYTTGKGIAGENFVRMGGTYNFGTFKIAAGQYNQKDDITNLGGAGTKAYDVAAHKTNEYGVEVPYGPWLFAATKSKADKNMSLYQTVDTTHSVTGLKVNYFLSKRTILMVEAASKKNTYNAAATTTTNVDLNGTSYFAGIQHTY